MKTLIYTGSLESGFSVCQETGRSIAFRRGEKSQYPDSMAEKLLKQNPEDWKEPESTVLPENGKE